jgi:AmmeMemoRadiSam system protein B
MTGAQRGTRQPAVAGSFYPDDAREMERMVDRCLDEAEQRWPTPAGTPAEPIGVLVPHAGLVYSGPAAAAGWLALAGTRPDTVVVVGTCHTAAGLHAIGVSPAERWAFPGGAVTVDGCVTAAVVGLGAPFATDAAAHAAEHAIEVQLPFMARLLPLARLVALTAGCDPHAAMTGGDALGALLADRRADGERIALAISTDFAHYPPAAVAEAVTDRHLPGLCALDAAAVLAVERDVRSAGSPGLDCGLCGLQATLAGLRALRGMGASRGVLVARATSADLAGSSGSRTVGYASLAFA